MRPSVVLDDDPTGTQAVCDLRVLLAWSPGTIAAALATAPAVHLMTNSRALPAADAHALVRDAAAAARAGAPDARVVLRGDSTLRGHVDEELRAVDPEGRSALLLVPALPAAGRVTRRGEHLLERDGGAVPLHETEYATDGGFAYRSARLLDWAEERSGGRIAAARGTEVPLEVLRGERPSGADGGAVATDAAGAGDASGAEAVAAALALAATRAPAACVPDAETVADLEVIAAGLRLAEDRGVPVTVRCAPAFAGVLSGRLATGLVDPPPPGAGVLVVCGSYVPATTAQLAALRDERGVEAIELDPLALAGPDEEAAAAVEAAAATAATALADRGLALVATARERPAATRDLGAGMRIARRLASVVRALPEPPGVVVAKGGITSHVTLTDGLGADAATVLGPLLPGVALWRTPDGVAYVVVPGNVGGPRLLVDLVDALGAVEARA